MRKEVSLIDKALRAAADQGQQVAARRGSEMRKLLGAATLLALALVLGTSPSMAQLGSGVYVRVDGGAGFSANTALADTDAFNPNASLGAVTYSGDAGRSALASAGIGVRLSPIFRIDVTGSYM